MLDYIKAKAKKLQKVLKKDGKVILRKKKFDYLTGKAEKSEEVELDQDDVKNSKRKIDRYREKILDLKERIESERQFVEDYKEMSIKIGNVGDLSGEINQIN